MHSYAHMKALNYNLNDLQNAVLTRVGLANLKLDNIRIIQNDHCMIH